MYAAPLTCCYAPNSIHVSRTKRPSNAIRPLTHHHCKQYPSVNFLKVDMEEFPYLAKSEDDIHDASDIEDDLYSRKTEIGSDEDF